MTEPPTLPGVAPVTDPPPFGPGPQTPWRRLDPRMLVVGPTTSLLRVLPVLIIVVLTGRGEATRLWIALALAALVVAGGVVRWRTTRYRITGERVELHSGLLSRRRRSVPRDRIRTVDLTAPLLHRAFGLSVVQVQAASGAAGDEGGLSLDAVTAPEADRLRRELLARSAAVPGVAPTGTPGSPEAEPAARELARLDWVWLRLAPLTFSSLAAIGAIGAAGFNVAGELGVDPREVDAVDAVADGLSAAPVWLAVLGGGLLLLGLAVVGSLLLFVERWWGYRLTADATGTLRVRRGLLTRRSLSVSGDRLRGVELAEPLLLRVAGRGAQASALTTGLDGDGGGGALQPPVPRAEAYRVASLAVHEHPKEIVAAPLRPHPLAARARRLTRALVPAAVGVTGVWLLDAAVWGTGWAGPLALLAFPAAVLLGLDRYRALGHELTVRHVVARQGSLLRRTVALRRSGVIGWTIRQSPFQRRAGLVTLTATTAAGSGGYEVLDVAAANAVALADTATPGLLGHLRTRPR